MTRGKYTVDNPPKSGNAIKLWRWWQEITGEPPRQLIVCRPGYWQNMCGAAHYEINGRYLIYSAADAIKQTMQDAQYDRQTGDYFFD